MLVEGFTTGTFQSNCYVFAAGPGAEAAVVDPGEDAIGPVLSALGRHSLRLRAVFITHGHLDHVLSARDLADGYGVPVYVHPADRALLTDPAGGFSPAFWASFGRPLLPSPREVREVREGDLIEVGELLVRVVETPGHTPGSVCYLVGGVVFTGDLIFAGSVGRTDLPGGSWQQLIRSIRDKILSLPGETLIYPGHGPRTSVEREATTNPFLVGVAG